MPMLRTGPSGPPLMGSADGDLLRWSTTTNEWEYASAVPYLLTEFDYILSSRADLVAVVAPIGGDFIVPTGSYFVKAPIALGDGERIVIDGVDVLMRGGGAMRGCGFVGDCATDEPFFLLQNGASVNVACLRFAAAQSGRHGLSVAGSSLLIGDDLLIDTTATGTQSGLTIESGTVLLARSRIDGDGQCVEHLNGGVRLQDCDVRRSFDGGPLIVVASATNPTLTVVSSTLALTVESSAPMIEIAPTGGRTIFNSRDNKYSRPKTESQMVLLSAAGGKTRAQFDRDRLFATGAAVVDMRGIDVDGSVEDLLVTDCIWENFESTVYWSSGTTTFAQYRGNRLFDNCTAGVVWPTANLPVEGLIESENQFETGVTPFSGHLASDAGVMRRQNFVAGVAQGETAIVP